MTAIMSKESSYTQEEIGVLKNFADKTTLHGVRNLGEDHVSLFKKICWLLLIIGFTAVMCYQVYQKVVEYRSNPIVTNIDVDYFGSLTFPAIAICNVNLFRISYTSTNIYTILEGVYEGSRPNPVNDSVVFNSTVLGSAADIPTSDIFLQNAAHMINRMILQCTTPSGANCNASDFTPLSTDYGICYAINTDIYNPWNVTSAGNSYGFQLLLNAETYEITNNPSKTAGFKVLIYNQTTKAMVGYSALDLAPGYMTQLGLLKQQNVKIDVANGGNCKSNQPLENYDDFMYSAESCRLNLIILGIQNVCNCRPYFAPVLKVEPKPRCTIEQHVKCVVKWLVPPANATSICYENCTKISYATTLSFSGLISSKLRNTVNSTLPQIMTSFGDAMEATSRVDVTTVQSLASVFDDMWTADALLSAQNLQPITATYQNLYDRLQQVVPCFAQLLAKYPKIFPAFNGDLSSIVNSDFSSPQAYYYYVSEVPMFQSAWATKCSATEQTDMTNSTWVRNFVNEVQAVAPNFVYLARTFALGNFIDSVAESTQTVYEQIFTLMEQYSNGTITRKNYSDQLLIVASSYWSNDFTLNFVNVIYSALAKNTQQLQSYSNVEANMTIDMRVGVQVAIFGSPSPCTGSGPPGPGMPPPNFNLCPFNCSTSLEQSTRMKIDDENFLDFVSDLFACVEPMETGSMETIADILNLANNFNVALQALLLDATQYVNAFDFDSPTSTFFQDNIAGVNIFFSDLSIEMWAQDHNYDVWSFACDIGGSMGLFLGASLMTMFEFIDLLITACTTRFCKRQPAKRNIVDVSKKQMQYHDSSYVDSMSAPMPRPFPR